MKYSIALLLETTQSVPKYNNIVLDHAHFPFRIPPAPELCLFSTKSRPSNLSNILNKKNRPGPSPISDPAHFPYSTRSAFDLKSTPPSPSVQLFIVISFCHYRPPHLHTEHGKAHTSMQI